MVIYWYTGNHRINNFKIKFYSIIKHFVSFGTILIIIELISLILKESTTIFIWISYITEFLQYLFNFTDNIEFQIEVIFHSIVNMILFIILFFIYIISFRQISKNELLQIQDMKIKFPFKKHVFKFLLKILPKTREKQVQKND